MRRTFAALVAGAEDGQLATPDQLDSLRTRLSTTFASVGYGRQRSLPIAAA